MENIRNISIIAHINHGKSTLVTRLIEICKNIKIEKNEQILDSMDIEKEKGITIKAQCLTLNYKNNKEEYIINIIDTPGHIDFSFEVNRSLVACQGVILLIDITKGIQAQTLTNYKKAKENNLDIIIAINKVDISTINLESLKKEIIETFNVDEKKIHTISSKTAFGVKNLLNSIIKDVSAPKKEKNNFLKAIIIDAWFNNYTGVNCLIFIKNGEIKKDEKIILISNKKKYKISYIGIFTPEKINKKILKNGEIGVINFGCKNIEEINIGDIITHPENQNVNFDFNISKITPTIYSNIYPIKTNDFLDLKISIEKLSLNDRSFIYSLQKSNIFGYGFKCGFLGMLHMEIIQERLEREYNLKIIITPPNVIFEIEHKNNKTEYIDNTKNININTIKHFKEPINLVKIISPIKYLGKINELCKNSRGIIKNIITKNEEVIIESEIPLNEIIFNFFKQLQNITNGFASFDYLFLEYRKADLIILNILINNNKIDILEFIIHKNNAYKKGKDMIERIAKLIPRQLFEVKIQAAIGKKIVAKTTVKALKKNVLSKCYGGDITRKKKLIKKQKEGKKRLKSIGNVDIPQNALLNIMNIKQK